MNAVLNILVILLQVYSVIILARVLLSWFPNVDYGNPLIRLLFDITEPVLAPVRDLLRQAMPQSGGMMLDFSPLVVLLVIQVLLVLMRAV